MKCQKCLLYPFEQWFLTFLESDPCENVTKLWVLHLEKCTCVFRPSGSLELSGTG